MIQERVKSPDWSGETIMLSPWPKPVFKGKFREEAAQVNQFREAVIGIRDLRLRLGLKPAAKIPEVNVVAKSKKANETLAAFRKEVLYFARVEKLSIDQKFKKQPGMVARVYNGIEIFVGGLTKESLERERERTEEKIAELEKSIAGLKNRLNDPNFVSRAPEEIV